MIRRKREDDEARRASTSGAAARRARAMRAIRSERRHQEQQRGQPVDAAKPSTSVMASKKPAAWSFRKSTTDLDPRPSGILCSVSQLFHATCLPAVRPRLARSARGSTDAVGSRPRPPARESRGSLSEPEALLHRVEARLAVEGRDAGEPGVERGGIGLQPFLGGLRPAPCCRRGSCPSSGFPSASVNFRFLMSLPTFGHSSNSRRARWCRRWRRRNSGRRRRRRRSR